VAKLERDGRLREGRVAKLEGDRWLSQRDGWLSEEKWLAK
jgi:hypothetical protein